MVSVAVAAVFLLHCPLKGVKADYDDTYETRDFFGKSWSWIKDAAWSTNEWIGDFTIDCDSIWMWDWLREKCDWLARRNFTDEEVPLLLFL
jgi:hypothetical protein